MKIPHKNHCAWEFFGAVFIIWAICNCIQLWVRMNGEKQEDVPLNDIG